MRHAFVKHFSNKKGNKINLIDVALINPIFKVNIMSYLLSSCLIWANELDWCNSFFLPFYASDTKLKFAVIGSQCQWYEKLEAIASLNVIYKDLWTNMLDSEWVINLYWAICLSLVNSTWKIIAGMLFLDIPENPIPNIFPSK